MQQAVLPALPVVCPDLHDKTGRPVHFLASEPLVSEDAFLFSSSQEDGEANVFAASDKFQTVISEIL